jgi:hypothetical protein
MEETPGLAPRRPLSDCALSNTGSNTAQPAAHSTAVSAQLFASSLRKKVIIRGGLKGVHVWPYAYVVTFAFMVPSFSITVLLLTLQSQAQTTEAARSQAKEEAKLASVQTAVKPAAKPTTAPQEVPAAAAVNVVSERQTNRIDRQVYDIKNDASTAGASVGDVLNNVPSVNVDHNGTIRLRGSERVTVLVDGKPTAQLQGENRAAAINALSAENFKSVQVINNPVAEFGN